MNKNSIKLTIFIITAVTLVSISVFSPYRDENEIYLAVLKSIGSSADLKEVAFLSLATNCKISNEKNNTEYRKDVPEDTWDAFFKANSGSPNPVRLTQLEGQYNIVNWEDTKKISDTQGLSLNFRATEKRIIKLSRVGFSPFPFNDNAILCIESSNIGLMYIVENSSNSWKVVGSWKAWGH